MTLEEARKDLIERLGFLPTGEDRLMYLVEQARKTPPENQEFRVETNRVEGCLSNLWFEATAREGKCFFRVDADSHVVRAIAIVLCQFYNDRKPEEILKYDPSFLSEAGITQHLSPNRRNGLSRLWEKIRTFALQQVSG
jgi:cysteine desulfuration protein SufE